MKQRQAVARGADSAQLEPVAAVKPLGSPSCLDHLVQATFAEYSETLQQGVHKTRVDF